MVRLSMARRSLGCSATGSSPISSRNSVPPWARSKAPTKLRSAPVKAPRSKPKSSDSMRLVGIEPQSTVTSGCLARALDRCSASATRSLPAPVSPRTSTVLSEVASASSFSMSASIAAERPMSPKNSVGALCGVVASPSTGSTRTRVRPSRTASPLDNTASTTRTPPTKVPFLEPRSRTRRSSPSVNSQWMPETRSSVTMTSANWREPRRTRTSKSTRLPASMPLMTSRTPRRRR